MLANRVRKRVRDKPLHQVANPSVLDVVGRATGIGRKVHDSFGQDVNGVD